MKKNDHFESLVRLFNAAPINQKIYPSSKLKISEGKCTYELTIESQYLHGGNALHGSVYFKMLDDAAYFAAASKELEYFLVTKSYEIDFIRPVHQESILATGTIIDQTSSGFHVYSELTNQKGKVVGKGQGEFVKSKIKLETLPDYGFSDR